MNIFGIRVKKELKEQGKKQTELAKKLNVGKTTLCEWVNGNNEPPMQKIAEIAIELNVTTDYLLGVEDENGNKTYINNSFNNFNNNGNFKI